MSYKRPCSKCGKPFDSDNYNDTMQVCPSCKAHDSASMGNSPFGNSILDDIFKNFK
jgi:Zn finger protein HypA/HybF involved in hydrogenase expression